MASTSNTMLNRGGESGYPCLVLQFSGKAFCFSPLNSMLAVGLSKCEQQYETENQLQPRTQQYPESLGQ